MRRLVAPLIVVIVLALAWCAGWYWAAGWAERNMSRVLAEIEQRGVLVQCTDRRVVGFPFALKAACAETLVTEAAGAAQARVAGLTGGVSVFSPRTGRIALASPAVLQSPHLREPASFAWSDAEIAVGLGMNGPRTVAFGTADLGAAAEGATVEAKRASGTLAPAASGGTDATLAFAGLVLSAEGVTLPPFDGAVAASLSAAPRELLAGLQAPLSASPLKVTLSAGEARVEAEGDVAVDAEGIVDGTIRLRIAGAEALPAFIAALPADMQKPANAAVGGIMAFGQPGTLDGEPATELVVKIEHGEARIGPVKVRVPRLPL
jgi:hypothetical protein